MLIIEMFFCLKPLEFCRLIPACTRPSARVRKRALAVFEAFSIKITSPGCFIGAVTPPGKSAHSILKALAPSSSISACFRVVRLSVEREKELTLRKQGSRFPRRPAGDSGDVRS